MTGITLDTGALIAIERGSRRLQTLLESEAGPLSALMTEPHSCLVYQLSVSRRK